MLVRGSVKTNTYYDSVRLMRVHAVMKTTEGVVEAACVMGTDQNKLALRASGLLVTEIAAAGPDDLVTVAKGPEEAVTAALARAEELLAERTISSLDLSASEMPRTLTAGFRRLPEANLALISVPGPYAAAEARKALRLGLHVHIFSDHVSLEDEIQLKQMGATHGLLVMGPDCGTVLLHGVPLGFGNHVARGPIGLVGASGTGIQEVSVLIDRRGSGISHALGTGGRDLTDAVCGTTTLMALDLLERDPQTRVVVLIAKAPGPQTLARLLKRLDTCGKPVVAAFLGLSTSSAAVVADSANVVSVGSLDEAAEVAVALAEGRSAADARSLLSACGWDEQVVLEAVAGIGPGRQYVRGLFAGGTLAQEAESILAGLLGKVYSNCGRSPALRLPDPGRSREHCVVDLGDDEFTLGRPHPMIDPTLRYERVLQEAADPTAAVILFDVILGVGAHHDPAGAMVGAIRQARERAGASDHASAGRRSRPGLVFVASVCGTDRDPQGYETQVRLLRREGVFLEPSSARAADLAGRIARQLAVARSDDASTGGSADAKPA